MTRPLRKTLVLALVAICAVAAGAPTEPARPGSARAPENGSGRTPGPSTPRSKPTPKATSTPIRNVSVTVTVRPGSGPEGGGGPPLTFYLGPSKPNPFHVTTTINFTSPIRYRARLMVFNVLGQRVATLLDQMLDPGSYSVTWGGTDDDGRVLPTGLYLYRLQVGSRESVRKVSFTH